MAYITVWLNDAILLARLRHVRSHGVHELLQDSLSIIGMYQPVMLFRRQIAVRRHAIELANFTRPGQRRTRLP